MSIFCIVFCIKKYGLHRSPETLRREVHYLNSNDMVNGIPLSFFAGVPWEQYLVLIEEVQMDSAYGDEMTLRAISNIFNVEIIIVSTLRQVGRVEIFPENTNPFARITLRYIAEGRGEHYVTLEDLNEVGSESEVDIMDIDNSAVEIIENKNEDNNLENLPEENINLEQLPLEILERIFLSALISSDYTFPNHVCWTLNNMINAVPVFRLFEKKGMDHLPRVYISDPFALPKQQNSGEIFVNMKRILWFSYEFHEDLMVQ